MKTYDIIHAQTRTHIPFWQAVSPWPLGITRTKCFLNTFSTTVYCACMKTKTSGCLTQIMPTTCLGPDSGKTPAQNSCMFLQESSQDNSLNMYEVCGRGNLWRIDWTTKHLKYVKYVANIIDTVIATRGSATICSLATILWRHLVTSCADKGAIWPSDHLITWGERLFQASQSKLCLYHQH